MESYTLDESEHERIFREDIVPKVLGRNHHPESTLHPSLTLVGGQPGAGKSNTINAVRAQSSSQGGLLVIDVDQLREFHPDHLRLMALDDRTAANHTHADASRWAEKLEAYGREHRFNILLESTLKHQITPWQSWRSTAKPAIRQTCG